MKKLADLRFLATGKSFERNKELFQEIESVKVQLAAFERKNKKTK